MSSKVTNPLNSSYEPTECVNTSVSAHSFHGLSSTINANGHSIVNSNTHDTNYNALSKQPTCCLHGLKCSKSSANPIQRSKNTLDEDPSEVYETANKFLQMKTILKADIRSKPINSDSLMGDPLKSVIGDHVDESLIKKAFQYRHGAAATSSLLAPYESLGKLSFDPPIESKSREMATGEEELYIEPNFNVINHQKRQFKHEKKRVADSERIKPLLSSSVSSLSTNNSNINNYGYELIADSLQVRQPVVEKMKVAANYDPHLHKIYIGELTANDAELRTKQKVTFKLYHQLPSVPSNTYDTLEPSLKLFTVYQNSRGNHYHFPIVDRKVHFNGSERSQFAVNYGESTPFFNSLSGLVKFYETFVILSSPYSLPEIFPWWSTNQNRPHRN